MPNVPYRAILCPVDFSSGAANSLRVGAELAFAGGVPLKVVYATHFEAPPYFTESAQMELAKQLVGARIAAQGALASWCQPHLPAGVQVSYEILERPRWTRSGIRPRSCPAAGSSWVLMDGRA
jgi:hypothetical protein